MKVVDITQAVDENTPGPKFKDYGNWYRIHGELWPPMIGGVPVQDTATMWKQYLPIGMLVEFEQDGSWYRGNIVAHLANQQVSVRDLLSDLQFTCSLNQVRNL